MGTRHIYFPNRINELLEKEENVSKLITSLLEKYYAIENKNGKSEQQIIEDVKQKIIEAEEEKIASAKESQQNIYELFADENKEEYREGWINGKWKNQEEFYEVKHGKL